MNQRRIFHDVFTLEAVIAGVVFVLVLAAVAYAVTLRRARAGKRPSHRWEDNRLESFYLAALGAVAAFLVVYTALQNHDEHRAVDRPEVRVDVTAFQWCWTFSHHPRSQRPVSVTGTCRGGDLPTLVVPTGRTIRLDMTSNDVIHSLWVPALRYKMDVFPHHKNSFTFTLDHAGEWIGRCAEFCGDRHVHMDFRLRAVSPEEYAKWLAGHATASAAGTPA